MLADRTVKGGMAIARSGKNAPLPKETTATIAKALATSDLKPVAKREMQDAVQAFSGTGSLDLRRYEAVVGKGKDALIVEMKELVPSSLSPHLGGSANQLQRYRQAQSLYHGKAAGDVTSVTLEGQEFLVRTRAPYKGNVAFADVKDSQQANFLEDLGKILGKAHAKGGDGKALQHFVRQHEDDLIQTAVKQARHSLDDFTLFAGQ
jgi:uncharacterized protein (DUF2252 family)